MFINNRKNNKKTNRVEPVTSVLPSVPDVGDFGCSLNIADMSFQPLMLTDCTYKHPHFLKKMLRLHAQHFSCNVCKGWARINAIILKTYNFTKLKRTRQCFNKFPNIISGNPQISIFLYFATANLNVHFTRNEAGLFACRCFVAFFRLSNNFKYNI